MFTSRFYMMLSLGYLLQWELEGVESPNPGRPFQLVLSGVAPGSRMERALRRQANYEPWADWIFISAEPYIEVFQAQRLVYLSPDGKDTADSFEDKDKVVPKGR